MCYNKNMLKRISFIGHREILDNNLRQVLKTIVEEKIQEGYLFFTMGTHGKFDEMALSVCRELRKTYLNIKIEVVITSLNKIKKIVDHDEIYGDEVYNPYDDVETVMYNIEETHFKRQIIESNQKMIDGCDLLIAYVNEKKSYGGAKLAYMYAKKNGKKIINLYYFD